MKYNDTGTPMTFPATVWAVTLLWRFGQETGDVAAVAHVCLADSQEEAVTQARAANPEVPPTADCTTHSAIISLP